MGLGQHQDEAGNWQLLASRGVGIGEVPGVFEKAMRASNIGLWPGGVWSPSASITSVSPTSFRPGQNIDISIEVYVSNPDGYYNTCLVVRRQDTGIVYPKTHGMIAASDSWKEPIVCGVMPSKSVELVVELWGHPDYYSTWP